MKEIVAKLRYLSRKIAEVEDDVGDIMGGGKPNTGMIKFLEEMGDRMVTNPNPNGRKRQIKLRSLPNTPNGKPMFDRYLAAWSEKQKRNKDKKSE